MLSEIVEKIAELKGEVVDCEMVVDAIAAAMADRLDGGNEDAIRGGVEDAIEAIDDETFEHFFDLVADAVAREARLQSIEL